MKGNLGILDENLKNRIHNFVTNCNSKRQCKLALGVNPVNLLLLLFTSHKICSFLEW